MTGWQEVYKKRLADKTIEELNNIIKEKQKTIKQLDKRTRNGKMQKIFEYADILVVQELIDEKQNKNEKGDL